MNGFLAIINAVAIGFAIHRGDYGIAAGILSFHIISILFDIESNTKRK